ncbi:GNAT family N-acetyltransferase [Candidatus Latescibacterota bacterium]
MNGWEKIYKERLMSSSEAIGKIRSGSRIFLGSGCAEPQHLLFELVEQGGNTDRLHDVEIVHIMSVGTAPHAQKRFSRHFRHNSLFVGSGVRDAVEEGNADYTPIFLSEIPLMLRSGRMPIDVAILQVSTPDSYGFCSFGISVEVHKAAADAAGLVIAQANPRMPRTLGDSFIHVRELDCIVEHTDELIEVPPSEPDDVSESIAKHISRLVENGSTIQVGIGKIPNAVLHYLSDKNDLGVHTEMLSDGFIDLINSGVINNSKKTFHPGKILAAYCIGTRKLYDYVDNNPMFEFHPTDYNSSPLNIAKNEKMVAINTALEVDLTGQVCSGSLGYKIYSGIGGQADFMRGAALAPQGKPIIALSSTAKNGTVSRIVPHLSEGAGVVITRGDVHYIATEYGVAYLHGKSLRERVISLINIAHPKFRDELLAQAKKHKYLFEDQFITSGAVYPVEIEHTQEFDDIELFFRPAKPSDERMLQEFLYQLSEKSVYQRFFHKMKAFPHELAQDMVSIDYNEKMGVVGILGSPGNERIVANGHWIMSVNESIAEVAFAVADKYQRRGIGTHFLKLLMRLAKEKGIHGFEATVISGNIGMMNVFKKSGCVIHSEFESGMYTLHFDFDEKTTE